MLRDLSGWGVWQKAPAPFSGYKRPAGDMHFWGAVVSSKGCDGATLPVTCGEIGLILAFHVKKSTHPQPRAMLFSICVSAHKGDFWSPLALLFYLISLTLLLHLISWLVVNISM